MEMSSSEDVTSGSPPHLSLQSPREEASQPVAMTTSAPSISGEQPQRHEGLPATRVDSNNSSRNSVSEVSVICKKEDTLAFSYPPENPSKAFIRMEDTEPFIYPEHPSEAFIRIHHMREDGFLCDVVLDIGGVKIQAHRLVLAASSSYFYSMFVMDMKEKKQDVVKLQGVDPEAMQLLVEFAYTTKLQITTFNVQSLMTAASLFNFPSVFTATSNFLCKQLHPSNCLGIRHFAKTLNSSELVNAATIFFRDHFTDTIENDEFLHLSAEDLALLLDSNDLNVRMEEEVYEAVQMWVEHAPQDRNKNLPLLLSSVRLPLLSISYLTTNVGNNAYIRVSLECRDLLDEAKNFHLMPEKFVQSKKDIFHPRKSTVGLLFAIGGRGPVGEPFNSVECYDFRTNAWYDGPELKSRRRHVGVACLGDMIFAVGGHDGNQHLNSVECYDPKVGHWEYVDSMKKLRRGIAVGVLGGPLYAVGEC